MASKDLIFICHLVDCYKNSCLSILIVCPSHDQTLCSVFPSHIPSPGCIDHWESGLATLSFRKICFAIKTPDCALLTVMIAFFFFPGLKKMPFTKGSIRSLDAVAAPAAPSHSSRVKQDGGKNRDTGSEARKEGGQFETKERDKHVCFAGSPPRGVSV